MDQAKANTCALFFIWLSAILKFPKLQMVYKVDVYSFVTKINMKNILNISFKILELVYDVCS